MSAVPSSRSQHIPGEPGVWILILGDMVMFGILFATFLYYRGQDSIEFAAAQSHLNRHLGILNTLLLLTSSWFVAAAVGYEKVGRSAMAARYLAGTLVCGTGFLFIKIFEYGEKIAGDHELLENQFFMFYFVMTGIHLLHLVLGMISLIFIRQRLVRTAYRAPQVLLIETGASFWHLVDLLWIILFPLLYLVH